jgi:hypothetical protein
MTFLHQKHHSKSPETETIQMPTGSKARRWWLTPVILATQDRSLKPAWGNSSTRPFRKKGWWSGSRCGPEFKPQYLKKKKKEKKKKKLPTEDGDIVVDYYTARKKSRLSTHDPTMVPTVFRQRDGFFHLCEVLLMHTGRWNHRHAPASQNEGGNVTVTSTAAEN